MLQESVAVEPVSTPETPAAAAPAPTQAPAPAPAASGNSSTATADLASEGQRKNVLITAQAKGADLAALLAELGFALNAATLDGMSNAQFKALKAKL